jgi:hypothetical protein
MRKIIFILAILLAGWSNGKADDFDVIAKLFERKIDRIISNESYISGTASSVAQAVVSKVKNIGAKKDDSFTKNVVGGAAAGGIIGLVEGFFGVDVGSSFLWDFHEDLSEVMGDAIIGSEEENSDEVYNSSLVLLDSLIRKGWESEVLPDIIEDLEEETLRIRNELYEMDPERGQKVISEIFESRFQNLYVKYCSSVRSKIILSGSANTSSESGKVLSDIVKTLDNYILTLSSDGN